MQLEGVRPSKFGLLHVFCCNVPCNLNLTTRVRVRQRSDRHCVYVSTLVAHRALLPANYEFRHPSHCWPCSDSIMPKRVARQVDSQIDAVKV